MSLLLIVGAIAAGGVFLAASVGALAWYSIRARKAHNCASNLAKHLGWKPAIPPGDGRASWYGGVAQGRRVAICAVAIGNASKTDVAIGSLHLRIVMDVLVRNPIGVNARRSHRDASSLHRFEEAFSAENAGRLGVNAKQAMVDFVAKGYHTGLHGLRYRSTRGTRNLYLLDRRQVPPDQVHPDVHSDARTILVHDHPDTAISQADFGTLLYEMAQVVFAIEQNR